MFLDMLRNQATEEQKDALGIAALAVNDGIVGLSKGGEFFLVALAFVDF